MFSNAAWSETFGDLTAGQRLYKDYRVQDVAFSHDGQCIVVSYDTEVDRGHVVLYDLKERREVARVRSPYGSVTSISSLRPDKRVLFLDFNVTIWDPRKPQLREIELLGEPRDFIPMVLLVNTTGSRVWEFAHEVKIKMSGTDEDSKQTSNAPLTRIRVFDGLEDPKVIAVFPHQGAIPSQKEYVTLDQEGEKLFVADERRIRMYSCSGTVDEVLLNPRKPVSSICGLASNPEGTILAVAYQGEHLVLYRVQDGKELARIHLATAGRTCPLAFSQDGMHLLTATSQAGQESLLLLNARDLTVVKSFDLDVENLTGIDISPDSRHVAGWGTGGVEVYSTK